jgi:exodeoxyribonuclease VII large subunit
MNQQQKLLTVSELTYRIKHVLETGFSLVGVQGEISNFKRHSSGHIYFTLKDESAQISAVLWRSRAGDLQFEPEDGMKVIVRGRITVYEVRGQYQIEVISIRPLGVGELQLAFERLKDKLMAEGLFSPEHKKPLPEFPQRIGIVTSPTGAALQDMLNILRRRFPSVEVILSPVRVQGPGASADIARAITEFNEYGNVDVLIVGRGGGSLEDLWSFNEENVARSIYASKIPVVSAVGHEVDFTIADFVADLRAPTPSAAAELVVKDAHAVVEIIRNNWYTMHATVLKLLKHHKESIRHLLKSYSFNKPLDLLRQLSQRADELDRIMTASMTHRLEMLRSRSDALYRRILALSPASIMSRGYVIVYKDRTVVSSSKKLHAPDEIELAFHDGVVRSIVAK